MHVFSAKLLNAIVMQLAILYRGTARPVIITDVGIAGISTLIECKAEKAHRHAKHVNTKEIWGHATQEI